MVLLLSLTVAAYAEVPLAAFPDCSPDNPAACPDDLNDWELLSSVPAESVDTVRAVELEAGAGLGLDRAIRYTAGRYDVPIAILDSGIQWRERRLYEKVLLNAGELPRPQNAAGQEVDDLDGNGIFNLLDYAEDPRVDVDAGQERADGRLDPSDLIATFSDGVDDDGNGYVDDIAGWDFFDGDNDPWAALQSSSYASHGTGVMNAAAQPGDDGSGIGTCPNCAVLPIRVGDTFITDGDRIGLAIAYATERGARVIGMAVGALSHPSGARAAIDYAVERDVVLVGAAGDENSWHHNVPALEDPILYVHTVRANGQNEFDGAFTYTSFVNCNNFGPRMDIVSPDTDCATGSVARISGAAGLLISAGIDAGTPLSGDEVRTILRSTAFDIALTPEETEIANTYPSAPGWDAFYGYGRVDLGQAVEDVFAGDLPASIEITSPEWFSWHAGSVTLEARLGLRGGEADWVLELGRGAEPTDWTEVASGRSAAGELISEVSLAGLPFEDLGDLDDGDTIVERFERAHRHLVTLRMTVTDDSGRVVESRRAFWPRQDPSYLEGYPKDLGSSVEAPPVLADLDGDRVLEVVVASSDGSLFALDGAGNPLAGFPALTRAHPGITDGWSELPAYAEGLQSPREGILVSPAVGDIDGDGDVEVVVGGLSGGIYAWHHDGSEVEGFPTAIAGRALDEFTEDTSWDFGVAAAPTLGDVDQDGDLDIIIAAMDQRLYVFDDDGSDFEGYPLELCSPEFCGVAGFRILSSPAVADLDGDGDLDAVVGTNEVPTGDAGVSYVVDLASATIRDGWPKTRGGLINQTVLPVLGEGHPSSVAVAELVDGYAISSQAMLGSDDLLTVEGEVTLELPWTASGFGNDTNYDEGALFTMITQPAFGDMTGDGVPDFAMGGSGPLYLVSLAMSSVQEFQHGVAAWDGVTGEMLPGFPRQVDDVSFLVAPTIADVTGDGVPELLYGSGGFLLYAWDGWGNLADGFPKNTGGWMLGGPALGDIDADGFHDVVAVTRTGFVHAWGTSGSAAISPGWASTFHDAQNTGNASWPLPEQDGPGLVQGGCCGRGGGGSAWMVFVLPLLVARRRV